MYLYKIIIWSDNSSQIISHLSLCINLKWCCILISLCIPWLSLVTTTLYLLRSFNHSVYLVETSEGPLQFHRLPQWPELDPHHRQQWQLHWRETDLYVTHSEPLKTKRKKNASLSIYILQLSPEGEVRWIVVDIYRDVLFTDPEGNSCFSIYQISWINNKIVT